MANTDLNTTLVSSDQLHKFIHNFVSVDGSDFSLAQPKPELLAKFINNIHPDTLYILQFEHDEYSIHQDITGMEFSTNIPIKSVIILIKLNGQLSSAFPLKNQLNILNIPISAIAADQEDSPQQDETTDSNDMFEKLRTLINLGLSPYFDLVTSQSNVLEEGSKNSSSSTSISLAKKKLNELSLSLQHLQQRIQIPDLLSSVHFKIQKLIDLQNSDDESYDKYVDELVADTSFLNELTTVVNNWIKQIQSITRLNHDPLDGESLTEEVQFWKSMELALVSITQQISSPQVQTSIEILNKAKRFHITLSFQNDIGLNDKMNTTKLYNSLLKEAPIDQLISVSNEEFDNFELAIINLFNHLKSKLKILNSFPIARSIELIEITLNDITNKFKAILSNSSLMSCTIAKFLDIYNTVILKITSLIDQNIKFMINLIRELLRKRQEKFIIIKINQVNYTEFKERLAYIKEFRLNHQGLLSILEKFFKNDSFTESNKLTEAYNKFIIPTNVLDLSKQGNLIWSMNEKSYLNVYGQLNSLIIVQLNGLFNDCERFSDFLTIFSTFDTHNSKEADSISDEDNQTNSLISLINDEYKLRILSMANKETETLIELNLSSRKNQINALGVYDDLYKFNFAPSAHHSTDSEAIEISSTANELLWNLSIISKLNFYLINLRKLLGPNWNKYSLGNKIDNEVSNLIHSLNPEKLFHSWLDGVSSKLASQEKSGALIKIISKSEDNYDLFVNYDSSLIDMAQQVHQISSLGFKIPVSVSIQFRKIEKLYPFIIGLSQHITIFKQIFQYDLTQTSYGKRFGFVLENQKLAVRDSLKQIMTVDWAYLSQAVDLNSLNDTEGGNSSRNGALIEIQSLNILNRFQSDVYKLYQQVNKLSKFDHFLSDTYHKLQTCEFQFDTIKEILKAIQSEFNKTLLEDFVSIDKLCHLINEKVKDILVTKGEVQLKLFDRALKVKLDDDADNIDYQEDEPTQDNFISISDFSHEIVFQDQSFAMYPPLSSSKQLGIDKLNQVLTVIESQEAIASPTAQYSYNGLISKHESLTVYITKILKKIDTILNQGKKYFNQWILLQNLWELNLQSDEDLRKIIPLNSSLSQWSKIIGEILELRSNFDTSETSQTFGNFTMINFAKVQSRVSLKFEIFQNNLIKIFSKKVQEETIAFNNELVKAKDSLENKLDIQLDVSKLVTDLDRYLKYKDEMSEWTKQLTVIKQSQVLLLKQRFKFTGDWIYVEQLENLISMISALFKRKDVVIKNNYEVISSKIKVESLRIGDSISSFINQWPVEKPVSGKLNPSAAITSLDGTQQKLTRLHDAKLSIINVSELLDIDIEIPQDLSMVLDEVADLKSVWSSINTLWGELESLKTTKWSEIQPRNLRSKLDDLLNQSRSLPSKVRQYSAFEEIQLLVKGYLKTHSFVSDLKSEAMKPRHWKLLLTQLSMTSLDVENLTIGDVWSLNFSLNETIIKNILVQANNEQSIEEKLNTIKNDWAGIVFEMFNYENKLRLVKNWNSLFDQCNNDINALSSINNSPYYHAFEQDITGLDDTLNKLYVLLDTWIDVQRQWVYLDGVFGNQFNDIKALLPIESTRFSNITYEFTSTLKRIYKYNLVIDILRVQDLQTIMDKLLESLVKVRKSLTDYLEKQRELFPRFYFVGNEDLLEIIGGGSTDITRINRHFKKMFAGISSVDFKSESSSIIAINSEQNEKVALSTPVSLIKFPRLNEWLKALEVEVKLTLSGMVKESISKYEALALDPNREDLKLLIFELPVQVSTLAIQIVYTKLVDTSIKESKIPVFAEKYSKFLVTLVDLLGDDIGMLERQKLQYLIIEVLHQRDVFNKLTSAQSAHHIEFIWNIQQQFFYDLSCDDPLGALKVRQANSTFVYGFEYLGIPEKLAYTPLIDKCFLTMTQALDQKLGGSPFGPAGTGKTESIKALGNNLGKMVLVFNCDDTFDFQSMGRIFLGLCKVGSWGCFDEFNRLDENILSAVSSQIENIEVGLSSSSQIEISGKPIQVHPETGIFVTMNPGYVGRFELPENLKKLFRGFSMEKPDREIIAEVLLTSQTFIWAREIAQIVVPFFLEIDKLTSNQSHYDFGLRALKNTLVRCGAIKRSIGTDSTDSKLLEYKLVLQSIRETIAPKLIKADELILDDLLGKYFPSISYENKDDSKFIKQMEQCCQEKGLVCNENWLNKAIQLNQIQATHHGLMLVGESGSGKSTIWKSVLESLSVIDSVDHQSFVIDCKVLNKYEIYGTLDPVTRDWTDGLFTSILRKIRLNLRGELSKRIWIIFDGDVDPEWAENLNSVLDDNKILTLPNGERLALPPNVRLIFEVDTLKLTTPATISRCGMIWFDSSLVPAADLFKLFIHEFSNNPLDVSEELTLNNSEVLRVQQELASNITKFINADVLNEVIEMAQKLEHIMDFTIHRTLQSFSTIVKSYCSRLIVYCMKHRSIPIDDYSPYIGKAVLLSLIWAFAGDCDLNQREDFAKTVSGLKVFDAVDKIEQESVIDFDISLPEFDWESWNHKVESIELEPQHVSNPNTVVPTLDTVRHEYLIYSILNEHKPLLLCGPPGSGKTMTLLEALRKSPSLDMLSLNFSKDTSPESLMKSLEQHCTYKKTNNGIVLTPIVSGKWVVVFCDEINLPGIDKYGTQRVISLLRQMIEQKGFWRIQDRQWVTLSNIQFVGACNSPNDPGRHRLSDRFLRHASVIMVDYPGKSSLYQIYQTFNLAVMKCAPDLRGYTKTITDSMIDVYLSTKERLTPSVRDHYIYSPRELTRWSRSIAEGLKASEYSDLSSLARLWNHEGLRLFYDRLVDDADRTWTKQLFRDITLKYFQNIDVDATLREPILYSNWLTSKYESVEEVELRNFVSERLRVFSEEEIEVNLVLHGDLLDYALRIDRVLRQPQGHMILVGPPTSGKTTLSKFVAWMNGLKVFQLNVKKDYGIEQFDSTLRDLLIRCAKGDKICFIIDESSILETSFIERMNTLLANAEIPGLFEGEEYNSLMSLCTEQSHSQGLLLDTNEELYSWFTRQISENLHVIFNISGATSSNSPTVISSPALFNRCVLSWMGDWSNDSLYDIAASLIETVPLDMSNYTIPGTFNSFIEKNIDGFRDVVVDSFIFIHRYRIDYETTLFHQNSPSEFLSLVQKFIEIFGSKQFELEENQRHISNGLDKLRETVLQVNDLKVELSKKQEYLKAKDQEAKLMLNKMLTDQNEAERKQEFSVVTQAELEKQEVEIELRKSRVIRDLEKAEPAVLEAQRGVQNIKKQHLTEIRSMSNPPSAVKMTMESVCVLIGYEANTWRDVQLIVRRDDFIANIVNFNNEEQLSEELREYMERTYLARDDYNFEAVYRASKACGPLLQWVEAQLNYSRILQNIGPLREEVELLEEKTNKTRAQLLAIDQMIKELEDSINTYKEDYSALIRDAENIKTEMRGVEKRVERSLKLIDNLTSERERWKNSIKKFGEQRDKLIGNSILSAAFLIYMGPFDQRGRKLIMKEWKKKLSDSGILFDGNYNFSQYLNIGDEILKWEKAGLAYDELNFENFTIMKNSQYPILIDPSGSIVNILSKVYSSPTNNINRKVVVTSFLNESYVKQLENSIRFGGIIIIQDAEFYDPILNTVLRREVHRNGGRLMIKFGEQEIDYSPDFKLFLYTKDSQIALSQFVTSRTSIVNFTITSGSLQNKVLNITLQDIKPEIEEKRLQLVNMKSEYQVKLYNLEEELLSSISDSSFGSILDNDSIIVTLENLKSESSEIDMKMKESETIMDTVDNVRNTYFDVAKHSSKVFSIIKHINGLHKLYKFELKGFIDLFLTVVRNFGSTSTVSELVLSLYKETFSNYASSLTFIDKIIFGLSLSLSYYEGEIGNQVESVSKILLRYLSAPNDDINAKKETLLSIFNAALVRYDNQNISSIEDLESLLSVNDDNETFKLLFNLIKPLSQSPIAKRDVFMDGFSDLSSFLFTGHGSYSSKNDLTHWVTDSSSSKEIVPIILASPEGYDATFKVEKLAKDLNHKLTIVSMGSKEGIEVANKEISIASSKGYWVLIQNIQMAASWLKYLERKLDSTNWNPEFKVFLTCNLTSNIPPSLVSKSKVFIEENQPGLKNVFYETLNSISQELSSETSSEFRHVCFLLSWFHSIIQERLRFTTISFKKKYDINDSDFRSGFKVLQKVFSSIKTNIKPEVVPWEQISYLIGEITYGGKIDDKQDLEYFTGLSGYLFRAESFESGFNLIENDLTKKSGQVLSFPEGYTLNSYLTWTSELPEQVSLTWIGLDEEVEVLLREKQGQHVSEIVLKMLQ